MTKIKSNILGFIASVLSKIFSKPLKADRKSMERMEFKSSTQRIGFVFAEKVRDIFRHRWLRRR